jgi:23S rRNA-/tRNA-specific pseudouridylate synthase
MLFSSFVQDTSGILIMARNAATAAKFNKLFEKPAIAKTV